MHNDPSDPSLQVSAVPAPPPSAAVWPPAPAGVEAPIWRTFRFLYERLEGHLSDLREGAVAANAAGIYLSGKAQPRAEIFQPVVGGVIVLNVVLGLIAYMILRYGCLQVVNMHIPWQNVRRVVSVTKRRKVCIVYEAPNYAGAIKTFCLAFSLGAEDFDAFLETARAYAPDRTLEGKLKPGSSLILRILAYFVLFLMLLIFGLLINDHFHPSASGAGGTSFLFPLLNHSFS